MLWQQPRKTQLCTELDDGVVLTKEHGDQALRRSVAVGRAWVHLWATCTRRFRCSRAGSVLLSEARARLMEADSGELFAVKTPLGFTVRVSVRYWATVVAKHPDLAGRTEDVQATLRAPEEVRQSRRDPAVLLFYRAEARRGRWVVAVAKCSGQDGFLVTAYRTDAIKEGERLWPK